MYKKPDQQETRIIKDVQLYFEPFGKGTINIGGKTKYIDPTDKENPEVRIREIILQTFISDHGGEGITHVFVKNSGSERYDFKGAINHIMRELFVNSSGFLRPKKMVVQDYLNKKGDRNIVYGEKFFSSLQKYRESHGLPYTSLL
jgi:hypothetical protein